MINTNDILWGQYQNFEGPYYRGKTPYELPANPDFWDKVLAVFTATEGGRFESLNMYDRCIVSLGLIQFCNAAPIFGVDRMLASCAIINKAKLDTYIQKMPSKPEFMEISGVWKFKNHGLIVDNKEEQRKLFLGTDGTKGSWDLKSKEYAKQNAAAIASIFLDPEFQQAQIKYIKPRLSQFIVKNGKEIIFFRQDQDGWWGALKAAFISFAGNLPSVANEYIKKAAENPYWKTASDEEKCIIALKTLTFGPKITIWPHRYNAIRTSLERLFEIDLPDFAEELQAWNISIGHQYFRTIEELQVVLSLLGYDLGPAGMDGKFGPKTSGALKKFELNYGLEPDGLIDSTSSKLLYEKMQNMDSSKKLLERLIELSDAVMKGTSSNIANILSKIHATGILNRSI